MSGKVHTTMKAIRNNWSKVFYAGYCELYDIFKYEEPQCYNAGVYGWNCDIYLDYSHDIAITTGYRNMTGKRIPSEIIKKYSEIAKEICSIPWTTPFEETKRKLYENRENFYRELENL